METFKTSASSEEIEVKTDISKKVFVVIIFTVFVILMIYKLPNQLFNWEKFNPNGITTLMFLAVLTLCLFSWFWLLDNQPKFMIKKDGFWVRKTFIPFSSFKMIAWKDIKHVEYSSERNKNKTRFFFVIHKMESSKTKRIELDDVAEPIEDILVVIRKFATIMNYVDRMKVTQ